MQVIEMFGQLGMSMRAKTAVRSKTKQGSCLVPKCGCESLKGHRGLCKKHYHQFAYAIRKRKSKTAKVAFELEQIRRGLVLPARRGRTTQSVFES